MEFTYAVTVFMKLEYKPGSKKSGLRSVDIDLHAGDNVDESKWRKSDGQLTQEGFKAQTQGLIQGLVAQIHAGEKFGYGKTAKTLRHVMSELERGFAYAGAEVTLTKR